MKTKVNRATARVSRERGWEENRATAGLRGERGCQENRATAGLRGERGWEENRATAGLRGERGWEENKATAGLRGERGCQENRATAGLRGERGWQENWATAGLRVKMLTFFICYHKTNMEKQRYTISIGSASVAVFWHFVVNDFEWRNTMLNKHVKRHDEMKRGYFAENLFTKILTQLTILTEAYLHLWFIFGILSFVLLNFYVYSMPSLHSEYNLLIYFSTNTVFFCEY